MDPSNDSVRFPLVRDGLTWREKCVPSAALPWLAEVERVFPGATKDIIMVRNSSSAPLREAETGGKPIAQEREREREREKREREHE